MGKKWQRQQQFLFLKAKNKLVIRRSTIFYFYFHKFQISNVMVFWTLSLVSTPISKGALLLVMFEWSFHINNFGRISQKDFECDCSVSFLYSTCIKQILHCIHIFIANVLSLFHYKIYFCLEIFFTNSCFRTLKAIQSSAKADFMRNSHKNVKLKHIFSRMYFQNEVLSSWE